MTSQFWKGRRVYITGHTGFKGAWLSLWLVSRGAHVRGYSLPPPTEPSLFERARVRDCIEHHIGDVRELAELEGDLHGFAPEVVFHLAAQSLVRRSYLQPVETFGTNVMGVVNLLEAVRGCRSVRSTVIVTSDKCYENREIDWAYREDDPMGGRDPYSGSKGAAEIVTSAYGRSYFSPPNCCSIASVRAGNVIGGGDWAQDRLVPDLVRGFLAGQQVSIRNPQATRPWQHVLECLSGYMTVAERLIVQGPLAWEGWNFGPDSASEQSVLSLARLACETWGCKDAFRVEESSSGSHEANLLKLDSNKARAQLNWQPRWSFAEAVTRSVEWYKRDAEGDDMRAFSLSQIEAYEAAAAHGAMDRDQGDG